MQDLILTVAEFNSLYKFDLLVTEQVKDHHSHGDYYLNYVKAQYV